ncbi:hypothetical protein [Stenotrophomonas bentonitica]|uniref:hypothetical protein n=1 Tax=Stenotrophomonas bentonitica TaxID=1450134 RepID=UPI00345EC426
MKDDDDTVRFAETTIRSSHISTIGVKDNHQTGSSTRYTVEVTVCGYLLQDTFASAEAAEDAAKALRFSAFGSA